MTWRKPQQEPREPLAITDIQLFESAAVPARYGGEQLRIAIGAGRGYCGLHLRCFAWADFRGNAC